MKDGNNAAVDGDGGKEGHGRREEAHQLGTGKRRRFTEEFDGDETAHESHGDGDGDDAGCDLVLELSEVEEDPDGDGGGDDGDDDCLLYTSRCV